VQLDPNTWTLMDAAFGPRQPKSPAF